MNREEVENLVRSMIQPLMRGQVASTEGQTATLDNLVPSGSAPNFQQTYPFGFVASPPKGVLAYFLNFFGLSQSPIILSHFHNGRPAPSAPGEVIVYCTSADGSSTPIKLTLGNDGTLVITASSKVQIKCDSVEVGQGTLEKVLKGETFQSFFNGHQHMGNLGAPTGTPIVQSDLSQLSTKVKAAN